MYCQGNAMVCSFFLRYFQCYLCIIIFCQFYSTLFYSITQGHCWTGNVAAKIPEIFILWEGNQVCSVYRREDPFHSVVKTNLFHPFLSIMKLQTQRERRKKKKKDFFMTLVIFTTHVFYDPFFTSKKKKKDMLPDDFRWLLIVASKQQSGPELWFSTLLWAIVSCTTHYPNLALGGRWETLEFRAW